MKKPRAWYRSQGLLLLFVNRILIQQAASGRRTQNIKQFNCGISEGSPPKTRSILRIFELSVPMNISYLSYAETLGEGIRRFADVLEKELNKKDGKSILQSLGK